MSDVRVGITHGPASVAQKNAGINIDMITLRTLQKLPVMIWYDMVNKQVCFSVGDQIVRKPHIAGKDVVITVQSNTK